MTPKELKQLRAAFAEYWYTEGCSCCQDCEGHRVAMAEMGKLLKIPMYADRSGYDVGQYRAKPAPPERERLVKGLSSRKKT